jgi:hypothetical protein
MSGSNIGKQQPSSLRIFMIKLRHDQFRTHLFISFFTANQSFDNTECRLLTESFNNLQVSKQRDKLQRDRLHCYFIHRVLQSLQCWQNWSHQYRDREHQRRCARTSPHYTIKVAVSGRSGLAELRHCLDRPRRGCQRYTRGNDSAVMAHSKFWYPYMGS